MIRNVPPPPKKGGEREGGGGGGGEKTTTKCNQTFLKRSIYSFRLFKQLFRISSVTKYTSSSKSWPIIFCSQPERKISYFASILIVNTSDVMNLALGINLENKLLGSNKELSFDATPMISTKLSNVYTVK